VNLLEDHVEKTAAEQPYEVPSRYRIDEKRTVKYARTEGSIYSALDGTTLRTKMKSYGTLPIEGSKALGHVEVVNANTQPDARKSLLVSKGKDTERVILRAYDSLLSDFEDDLVATIRTSKSRNESLERFCVSITGACPSWPVQWADPTDAEVEAAQAARDEELKREAEEKQKKKEEAERKRKEKEELKKKEAEAKAQAEAEADTNADDVVADVDGSGDTVSERTEKDEL
jgi:hypothetical protein